MGEEKENMNGFWQTLVITIAVMLLAIFGVFVIHKWIVPNDTTLSDANLTIVLSFIGVLATFIVIGNFSQVSEIRHNMERDLDKVKTDISTAETNIITLRKAIKILQEDLPKQKEDLKNDITHLDNVTKQKIKEIKLAINDASNADKSYTREEIDKVRNSLFDYKMLSLVLAFSNYGEVEKVLLLFKKLLYAPEKNVYMITLQNGQSITASAQKVEEGVEFYDQEKKIIDHSTIKSVDGFEISYESLSILLEMYGDLRKQNTSQEYSGKEDIPTEDSTKSDDDTDETSFNANDNTKNPES